MKPLTFLIATLILAPSLLAQAPGAVGTKIRKFVATDLSGDPFDLGPLEARPTVIAWTSLECPMSRLFSTKLPALAKQYQERARVVVVDSCPQDTVAALQKATEAWDHVRIVSDPSGRIAKRLGVTRTTEVVLLDAQGVLRYRGAIDDQYGYERSPTGGTQTYRKDAPRNTWLNDALEAVLRGDAVPQATSEPLGCALPHLEIETVGTATVTYHEHVQPLLQANCQECHRSGGSAPFPLVGYEQTRSWGAMIAEVATERRMPPWGANPEIGHFKNARRLSTEQIELLSAWARSGMPKGDPSKAQKPPTWPEGWVIGEPDVVFDTDEFEVPATGRLPYRYVRVRTNFAEDRWIQAAQFRSTGQEVLHHLLVFAEPPRRRRGQREAPTTKRPWAPRHDQAALFRELSREERREVLDSMRRSRSRNGTRGDNGLGGYLLAALPGNGPTLFGEDEGRLLPAGSTLVFQLHFNPSGKATKSKTTLALKFRDTPPARAIHVSAASSLRIFIPPGAEAHDVKATFRFPRDATLVSLRPHLHLRGKSFRYTLVRPDGEREILLDVPHYDFDWQHAYDFAKPLAVARGSVLEAVATYDNSTKNPYNPDPTRRVLFGLQTDEEMMVGYLEAVWSQEP